MVYLLVAAEVADRVEHGVVDVGLHHHAVVFEHHQRAVVDHAFLPEADVAQGTGHLSTGQVVIRHLDHRGYTIVVCWWLDRVLHPVVGVPVFPVHTR